MNRRIELFNWLLFIFVAILSILFFFLYKIELDTKNYSKYLTGFSNLFIVNSQLNSFLEKRGSFTNFDTIQKKLSTFDNDISFLINSDIKKDFSSDLDGRLKALLKKYKDKKKLIERFKSQQVSTRNCVQYVYGVNKYFIDNNDISHDLEILINKVFFLTIQYLNDFPVDKKEILQFLAEIKKENKEYKLIRLDFLNIYVRLILDNIDYMNKIEQESKNIDLYNEIKDIHDELVFLYEEKLFYKFFIFISFFISILLIVLLIYKEHIKIQKIKSELSAFRYAVEHGNNSVIITDKDKNILYVNELFEKLTGYKKEDVLGQNPKILNSGENSEDLYTELHKKLDNGEKWEGDFINRKKDGSLYYEKASIVPIYLNKKLINYLAIKFDITKYIIQNEEIRLASIAFENIQEGILICDSNRNIIAVNSAFQNIMGYDSSEIVGKKPNMFKSGLQEKSFYTFMHESLEQTGSWKGKIFDKRKDGRIIPFLLNITAIKNDRGVVSKYVAVHTNLEEIISSQEKADFLAYHDSLTNLPNREKLQRDLPSLLSLANRTNLNIFILFLDLDRFKVINDTLGHGVGDKLLIIVANRIKDIVRDTDIVARMGGDEFIVVLESCKDKKSVGLVCNKILEVLKEPIEIENFSLITSASIGISMFPDDGFDMTTLIKNADTAMYHAKQLGKNNYQYYDKELSLKIHEQLQMEQAIKDSILEKEFYLKYQPQYDLKNQEILSLEALLRWEHPVFGNIRADKFIPIAEEMGEIIKLDRFVLESVCRDLKILKEKNFKLKYIAINVSTIEFKGKDFLTNICKVLDKYGVRPDEIELEITERHIMDFTTENMQIISELKKLGFRFSIDDFGTGYSSLAYLTKLPIDSLKIDKSFIDGLQKDNNHGQQIVKAIIALSKSLNYDIVAEGVEREEDVLFLEKLDCNIIQGYFFYKPLIFDDLIPLLKA